MAELDPFTAERLRSIRFEHETVCAGVRQWDDIRFRVKGWTVTLWSALVAFGLSTGGSMILGASIVVVAVFWVLDSYTKVMQRVFIDRNQQIEAFLRSNEQMHRFIAGDSDVFPAPVLASRLTRERRRLPNLLGKLRALAFEMTGFQTYYLYLALGICSGALILLGVAEPADAHSLGEAGASVNTP